VILLLMAANTVVCLPGYADLAFALHTMVLVGASVYVLFIHSWKRWSGIGWTGRLKRMVTFRAD
jgi:hypothetical protein